MKNTKVVDGHWLKLSQNRYTQKYHRIANSAMV